MRILILAAALGATILPSVADAQSWSNGRGYSYDRSDNREAQCRRALRRADTRWEYRQAQRQCRDLRRDRRGHNDDRRWRDDDRRRWR
jgi:hypothetical protein